MTGRASVLRRLAVAVFALLVPLAFAGAPAQARALPSWQLVPTGSASHFRALAAVSRQVVWLGGYTGTVLRTVDGGATWQNVSPPGAGTRQFRDIAAFDADHAVAMAAGTARDSLIEVTSDGGRTWRVTYRNTEPAAFFDCMSFSDSRHGLVLSDPVGGRFRILRTSDGGASWSVVPRAGMPAALPGEYGFAASGQCLTTLGHDAWFGGGGSVARVFHSRDGGTTWEVATTPLAADPSSGINGLAFRTPGHGIAVGGSFATPAATAGTAAVFTGQLPWVAAGTDPGGYRSGVAFVPGTRATAIAVGLTGSDISLDAGRHWTTFATGQFDTVDCAPDGACWASGAEGRVAILRR